MGYHKTVIRKLLSNYRSILICILVWAIAAAITTSAEAQKASEWLPGSIARSGVGHYRSSTWSLAKSGVANPSHDAVDLILAYSYKQSPFIQFASPVWLPPRAERQCWQSLRAPHFRLKDTTLKTTIPEVLLLDQSKRPPQLARAEGIFAVQTIRPSMCMMKDPSDDEASVAISAMRLTEFSRSQVPHLSPENFPVSLRNWQPLDCLAISYDRPSLSTAQLQTLRRWIASGGRLWVFAEQVSPSFMRKLMGDQWTCQVIDELELNRFVVSESGREDREPLSYDKPVKMVRVVAPDWRVIHRVRGWPASLIKPFGLGSVMLTTVGPRAWYELNIVRKREIGNIEPPPEARPHFRSLISLYHRPIEGPPLPVEALKRYTASQIGYQTIGRSRMAGILGIAGLGILLVGLVAGHLRRLEYGTWGAIVVSVVGAVVIGIMGFTRRSEVPLTVSTTQFLQVLPATESAVTHGAVGIYSPTDGNGPLSMETEAVLWPDLKSVQANELVRVRRDDIHNWTWDGLKLPPGAILSATLSDTIDFNQMGEVVFSFGPTGLVGSLDTLHPVDATRSAHFVPGRLFEDAVLVTGSGRFAVDVASDHSMVIEADDQLFGDQYVGGVALSSLQRRRQEVCRSLLARAMITTKTGTLHRGELISQDDRAVVLKTSQSTVTLDRSQIASIKWTRKNYPQNPMFIAWTDSVDLGISLPQEHLRRSAMLMAVPARFATAPIGQRVFVPTGMISYELVRGPTGDGSRIHFDKQMHQWIPARTDALLVLRFTLPTAVMPLSINGGTWALDINAPGRVLTAYYGDGVGLVEIAEFKNKLGPLQIALAPFGQAIHVDPQGAILLALRVTNPQASSGDWHIRDIQLEVHGQVSEPVEARKSMSFGGGDGQEKRSIYTTFAPGEFNG